MKYHKNQHNLESAINLMETVGNDLLKWRKGSDFQKIEYKKGIEVVSKIDLRAEKKIRAGIRKIFPSHKIWGEELGRESGDIRKEKFIIIDPIDGSKNYLANNPLFASQIACIENGTLVWGIINIPELKEMYWAIKDRGSWCNGEKIFPSKQKQINLALQCFGIGHSAQNFITLPNIIKTNLAEPRHYGCAGVHFSFVANGRTDIYIAQEAAFYDMAAGILLCQEAGLLFCDLNGKIFKPRENKRGLVIGNKHLISQYKKIVTK